MCVGGQVEQAQLAHLCTVMSGMHHRRAGYPFGTLTDFASDGAGFPVFCLSPLAIHTRNIIEDPRCSLVVQLPGWTGLANARVTIFGDVFQLPPELQESAKEVFLQKQARSAFQIRPWPRACACLRGLALRRSAARCMLLRAASMLQATKRERWVSGNFSFFRMHRISDIYFVGGFGTVQWVDVAEYASVQPDQIALVEPHHTLKASLCSNLPLHRACWSMLRGMVTMANAPARHAQVLNERFSGALRHKLSRPQLAADDAAFISIDRLGTDVRVRHGNEYSVERLSFDTVRAAALSALCMQAGSPALSGAEARAACTYAGGGADCDGQLAAERQPTIAQAITTRVSPLRPAKQLLLMRKRGMTCHMWRHHVCMQSGTRAGKAGRVTKRGMRKCKFKYPTLQFLSLPSAKLL